MNPPEWCIGSGYWSYENGRSYERHGVGGSRLYHRNGTQTGTCTACGRIVISHNTPTADGWDWGPWLLDEFIIREEDAIEDLIA